MTVIALSVFHQTVHAALIGKMIRPYASYTVIADDNILRIRDRMDAQALLGTNNLFDFSHRFTGGAVFDKTISRQQLSANGSWSYQRYEKFSQINNKALDLSGNWNWFLGNRLEGNMGANFVRGQAPFLFQPGVVNIRTQQTEFFDFAWRFHPSWRLRGDYAHFNFKSDNVVLRFQNRVEDRFGTGFDYLAASGSSVGIEYRNIQGEFTAPIQTLEGLSTENNYNQNEIKGKIDWILTGKSRVKFHGGWVERTNASFSSSDFNGFNARLTYDWKPTSKTGIILSGWRETVAIQSLTANFSLITGASVSPVWNLTEKIKLAGNFSYLSQKFDRFRVLDDQPSIGNNNNIITASMELSYVPYYGIEISASAYHNSLTSNSPLGGFNANGGSINLRYIFGKP